MNLNPKSLQKTILKSVDYAKNGIIITDVDGNILWCNHCIEEATGYSAEELIGKEAKIFSSKENPPELYKDMWETIKVKEEYWEGKILNKKKDGTRHWERLCITPVKNNEGTLEYFIGVKIDITDAEEMKLKLKSEIKKTQKLINKHKLIKKH